MLLNIYEKNIILVLVVGGIYVSWNIRILILFCCDMSSILIVTGSTIALNCVYYNN